MAAAGSGGPRLVVESSEQETEEYERLKRQREDDAKPVVDDEPSLLEALQRDKIEAAVRRYEGLTFDERAKAQMRAARARAIRAHGGHPAPVNSPADSP